EISDIPSLSLIAGSHYIPKKKPLGEDAHFICEEARTIGVADGVGGWAKKAYSNTKAAGSATACIITLKDQSLRAVNVGDCGFRVIRNGCCIYRSPVQLREFNFPYQLAGNSDPRNNPGQAEVIKVDPIENGDVIVAGSDGLFDNMFDYEIQNEVNKRNKDRRGAQETAQKIAMFALHKSCDKIGETPFSLEAKKAGVARRRGGKPDDISVIVAYSVGITNMIKIYYAHPRKTFASSNRLVINDSSTNEMMKIARVTGKVELYILKMVKMVDMVDMVKSLLNLKTSSEDEIHYVDDESDEDVSEAASLDHLSDIDGELVEVRQKKLLEVKNKKKKQVTEGTDGDEKGAEPTDGDVECEPIVGDRSEGGSGPSCVSVGDTTIKDIECPDSSDYDSSEEDDEGEISLGQKSKFLIFNPSIDYKLVEFQLGMRCSKCKEPDHNRTTCQKDVSAEGESSKPTKKARKEKELTTTPTEDPSSRPKTKSKGRTKTKGKGKETSTAKGKDKEATTAKGTNKPPSTSKGRGKATSSTIMGKGDATPSTAQKDKGKATTSSGTEKASQNEFNTKCIILNTLGLKCLRVSKKTTDTTSTQVSAHLGTQGSTTTNAVPAKSPNKKKPTTLGLKRTRKRTIDTRATIPGVNTRSAASPMKQQWKI
ncbi:hypothetical protein IFM89_014242, partial [Coptis chinensis]